MLLATTLCAGLAIGSWHERANRPPEIIGPLGALSASHEHVMQLLDHALDLDSAQREVIGATLRRHQGVIDSAWRAIRPQVHATLDSIHREIMAVLRPEQREAFLRTLMRAHAVTPP